MSHPRSRQKRYSLPLVRPGIVAWLVGVYCRGRRNSGFILPTATLLVVIAFLIMMSLLARTANRVAQVSGQRERIAIEGPSGESIDRARAKLEYMFTREALPTNPMEHNFEDFLGNRARDRVTGVVTGARSALDLYTLPDESRCGAQDGNCLGAGQAFTPDGIAPTWAYPVDLNGNGTTNDPEDGVAVYSIIGRVFRGGNSAVPVENPGVVYLRERRQRAANFLVNNAPTQAQAADAFCAGASGTVDETGRFSTASSAEQLKNFQIYAVTMPNRIGQPQLTTNAVVFQQDRRFTGANKWGAYFRYDLEVFPGPEFRWNGAMHTEGTLFLQGMNRFESFLISAPNSCYFLPPTNSQLSARGLVMSGTIKFNTNDPGPNTLVHLQPAGRIAPTQIMRLATTGGHPNPGASTGTFNTQDSVQDRFSPVDLAMDPLYLVTNNLPVARRREGGSESYATYKDPNWGGGLATRIQIDKCEAPPYVDDTFRADNRLGPKPSYARGSCDGAETWETLGSAGDPITGKDEWTRRTPSPDQPDEYGLDGYWERRAVGQGMKVIVGQRLELGNVGVWGGWRTFGRATNWSDDAWRFWAGLPGSIVNAPTQPIYDPTTNIFGNSSQAYGEEIFAFLQRPRSTIAGTIPAPGAPDPLYPPHVLAAEFGGTMPYNFTGVPAPTNFTTRVSEQLHRRTQRDNLAAVQAAAVYHHRATEPSLPMLCLSSTIHPGTEASYFNSITYGDPVSPAVNQIDVSRYPRSNANFVRPIGTQAMFPPADFFTGRGTANMEYGNGTNPTLPPFNADDFDDGTALRKALTNLAYFAGDPNGAYPPRQAPPGSRQVYPDPVLTMWGNFSNLRRTIETLDGGTDYANLSPADQSNLHTAGCAMSLLATNVQWYLDWGYFGTGNDFYRSGGGTNPHHPVANQPPLNTDTGASPNIQIDLQRLASALRQLQDRNLANFEIGANAGGLDLSFIPMNTTDGACATVATRNPNCYNIPAEYYIAALARIRDSRPFNTAPTSEYQQWHRLVYLARMLNTRLQIVRDRTYGFREYIPGQWIGVETVPHNSGVGVDTANPLGPNRPNNQRLAYQVRTLSAADPLTPYTQGTVVNVPCDLSLVDINYFGYKAPSALAPANPLDQLVEREMLALARLCPTQPKYPSLYYLFPGDLNSDGDITGDDAHGHDGRSGINRRNSNDPSPYNQPSGSAGNNLETFSEPYVLSRYIAEEANSSVTYEQFNFTDLNALRLAARNPEDNWQLPRVNLVNNRPVTDGTLYQRETDLLVSVSQAANAQTNLIAYRTGLAEKALYNGRQMQMTRVMDFDLDLLRDVNRAPFGDDAWLVVGEIATVTTPRKSGGIIYAFREDAVREDAILRPANSDWASYETAWRANYQDGPPLNLRMNPDPRTPSDPPKTPVGISGKPVDYYADPDRRDHGFRLMNGNDISRLNAPPARNIFGMSFITDNSMYIMTQLARGISGFNLHATSAGAPVQEFTTILPLPYNFNDFYNRLTRNLAFATPTGDTWRPVEILADAITLLSHNFCDGYQENGIRNVRNSTAGLPIPGKDNGNNNSNGDCHGSAAGGPSTRNTAVIENTGVPGFTTLESVPSLPRDRWARENPYDIGSPIIVGSDGAHRTIPDLASALQAAIPFGNYTTVDRFRGDNVPSRNTNFTVNAVIVSGVVPSRRLQAYGGVHNLPRFIERDNTVTFQGSLIQLAFSNYATVSFDMDSFERTQVGTDPEPTPYFGAPQRLWGYDPGLQYAPAGPVSQRFLAPSNARSEYFLELTAQDPYTCQLQRFIVPGLTCP